MSIIHVEKINLPDDPEINKYLKILRSDQRGLFINKLNDTDYQVLWIIEADEYQWFNSRVYTREEVLEYLIGLINGFGIRTEND